MNNNYFYNLLLENNIKIDENQLKKFELFKFELIEFNFLFLFLIKYTHDSI